MQEVTIQDLIYAVHQNCLQDEERCKNECRFYQICTELCSLLPKQRKSVVDQEYLTKRNIALNYFNHPRKGNILIATIND